MRANNPTEHDERLGLLAGTAELPIWIGLLIGFAAAAIAGEFAGIVVGVVVPILLAIIWLITSLSIEKKHLKCLCERCTTVFSFNETLPRRKRHES